METWTWNSAQSTVMLYCVIGQILLSIVFPELNMWLAMSAVVFVRDVVIKRQSEIARTVDGWGSIIGGIIYILLCDSMIFL